MDLDVLFAAALLHDLAALPRYAAEGADHGARSAELAGPLLKTWGFPLEKLPKVKAMIAGHVFTGPAPASRDAAAFRDADILDFLGDIGAARILAATQDKGFTPTLGGSLAVLRQFASLLPAKLTTPAARKQAPQRVKEMTRFMDSVRSYGFGDRAL